MDLLKIAQRSLKRNLICKNLFAKGLKTETFNLFQKLDYKYGFRGAGERIEFEMSFKKYAWKEIVFHQNILADYKVMILQEVNEPFLNMAVSKAATLLGAYDVNIIDHLAWEHDYMGRVFSFMADAIFVATMTHMCVQRFANQSTVPVVCMRSRTHASIQSLATMMAIMEEFGSLKGLNLSYFGSPHPVLNSYLLLCPMLGMNIKFMCCCEKTPISPLLYKASEDMTMESHTQLQACSKREHVLQDAKIVIAGPANPKKVADFKLSVENIECQTKTPWIFFHTGPRGEEVDDKLFFNKNSKTFVAFENFHYIAAALMANVLKDHKF